MKQSDKVMELMSAYPGRPWRMVEIVRFVCPSHASVKERSAVRQQVWNVLQALVEIRVVRARRPSQLNGRFITYIWQKC